MTDPDPPSTPDAAVLERAVEAAGHAIYTTDPDGRITYVNPAFEETTGYGASEAVGRTPAILASGEHPPAYHDRLWETITAGDVWDETVVNRRKDGSRYVAHQTIAPVTSDGDIEGYVAIQTDVTEQRRRERRLRQYERAIEGAHDLIAAVDENYEYLFANERYREFHGFDPDELGGLSLRDIFDDEMLATVEPRIEQALEGSVATYRTTRSFPGTDERTFDVRYYPLEDDEGAIHGVVATMRDLTDLLEHQRNLMRSRALLANTERLAEMGGWELDVETEALRWTDGVRRIHGRRGDGEPSLEDALEHVHPGDRPDVLRALAQCNQEGIEFDLEARLVTARGRIRWVRITGERIDRDGREIVRGAIKDVTDRRQREQRLMVLNRVLRHNLRNELTTVKGYAELLEEELAAFEEFEPPAWDRSPPAVIQQVSEVGDLSASIRTELETLERLLDRITSFPFETALSGTRVIQENSEALIDIAEKAQAIEQSAEADQILEAVPVRPHLEDLAATYREEFPEATISVRGDDASIAGNETALRRIVAELLENAVEHTDREALEVTLRVHGERDDIVTIEVADTGPGIPEMERETIRRGEETPLMHGSGIGLWLVHWLVTNLDGTVTIGENEPRGTIVSLELPAA